MESRLNGRAILDHLAREVCVSSDVSARFWTALAGEHRADQDPIRSARQACSAEKLFLTGRTVDAGYFQRVARICSWRDLEFIDRAVFDSIFEETGIEPSDMSQRGTLSRPQLQAVEAVLRRRDGRLAQARLGNLSGLVWVTEAIAGDDPATLRQALALDNPANGNGGDGRLVLLYTRGDIGENRLCRPTSIDGIDQSMFLPLPDCDVTFGRTAPNGRHEDGRPEAVHASIRLTNVGFLFFIST